MPAVRHSNAHVFTVDVEEYFQVHAFQSHVSTDDWSHLPSRVERNVEEILTLLDGSGSHATFFVLGWIADRYPEVVRMIAAGGHEIASHGWSHRKLTELAHHEVCEELKASKEVLEDVSGQEVLGFRAPGFSLTPGLEWVLDELLTAGYVYDSSLFPIRRPAYGYPGVPAEPHLISRNAGILLELPPSTLLWQGLRLPAGGGGYFRRFPYRVTQRALRQSAERGMPAVFYVHPWEVDEEQPRLDVSFVARLRHYGGLSKMRARLARLLGEFPFTSIARRFDLEDRGLVGNDLSTVLTS